ncbi:chain-length determining protein [Cobetia sp. 1CM21F]|uniref:chain-length determining protein n=1 Tax=Cobetia sp. 1CM21F TaxID=2929163 RepID=UPI0020C1538C|nr:chain-length determining protein [Cobetia sp. 1CM21F]MCK8066947.1 chain-length determining protein [Cobetia sp. 1CM21F]
MRSFLKKYPYWALCFFSIFVVALYWSLWASDRYVSEANVVLESPQVSVPSLDVSSLLTGGGSSNSQDMLLLRDFLLSTDMLKYLVDHAGFRQHYANSGADFFTRLKDEDAPLEKLHEYYLKRVSVELDSYAGVLRIKVQALTPEKAHQIASLMLSQGEAQMNLLGQRLAQEQVEFLEQQVAILEKRFDITREALLTYQNENGLVSPSATIESLSTVVASLEGQLASLKAQKNALLSYQSKRSSQVIRIDSQIKALNDQINSERDRLARQSGNALNTLSNQYQTLQLKAEFAQQSYSGALSALETTRIEAARKLKQLSILQKPTYPEYSVLPERGYNIILFAVALIFISITINMVVLIIKDHKD